MCFGGQNMHSYFLLGNVVEAPANSMEAFVSNGVGPKKNSGNVL